MSRTVSVLGPFVMIGIAPRRRGDIARLGLKSILGGSLAAFMTATITGILL